MLKADAAIIGAGFAGAAVAWHLGEMGCRDVLILEREDLPGMHASGQNASMMRQFEEDPLIANWTFKGGGFILTPPYRWGHIINQVGSIILFKKNRLPAVRRAMDFEVKLGLETEIIERKDAIRMVPPLADADFEHAIWTATDGVVDINAFLWAYLKDAKEKGAKLKLKQAVIDIRRGGGGAIQVVTEEDVISAKCVVNAAGAWASDLGRMAGAADMPLTPYRRHLYQTTPIEWVDPKWPFVWDIDNQYYFRPESGGLLLGPCDEEAMPPGVPSTSHIVREELAEKLGRHCPRLANITVATEWAGLRTFASDRHFVLGRDPKLESFYWAAGLGGVGVTTSNIVGKAVAELILGKGDNIPKEFRPERFS